MLTAEELAEFEELLDRQEKYLPAWTVREMRETLKRYTKEVLVQKDYSDE